MKCEECRKKFYFNKNAAEHFHTIQTLSDESPLVFLVNLPDGCTPGRLEAAREFTAAISALRKQYPSRKFQYIPFDHSDGAVNSLLAIEQ